MQQKPDQGILQRLPLQPLIEIISFLDVADIFQGLSLTNTKFHQIISSSPYIFKSLFENLLGRKFSPTSNLNLTPAKLKQILASYYKQQNPETVLPFYGFRGNCGCDEDMYEFLFDKIFEPREAKTPVCTRVGENFNIEGVLSTNFGKEARQTQEVIALFDQLEPSLAHVMKEVLNTLGLAAIEPFLEILITQLGAPEQSNALRNIVGSWKEEKHAFVEYVKTLADKHIIELNCNKMTDVVGLVHSCEINRDISSISCPMKTIMAFASMNEEIGLNNPVVSLFDHCKTPEDLRKILISHRDQLPTIRKTSIQSFLNSNTEYIDKEEDEVDLVVFNSNGRKSDVIPLFWVRFRKAETRKLLLDLKDSNLSARYVMLKLVECEDLTQQIGDTGHIGTNIDVNFCSFHGSLLQLTE